MMDADMREKLLQCSEKNFDKLVTRAIAVEAARFESKQLRSSSTVPAFVISSNVNKIKNSSKPHKTKGSPNVLPQFKKSDASTTKPADSTEIQCYCCGKKNHKAND